ncbi:hypothetical protein [Chlorogloea sp. CCALA 695]|uniref:hypothetical protein n=1 Tax=Chlorogloea sp. CCALA 695 TaxID=2107693 RepID=UPI000D054499|nr:hypothetical protein [Chlorogloea sp. CCALA 695]PSB33810.1 hypothetical protein C7B70_05800 [Chlorogloea sp. CCALA 695]
MQSQNKLNKLIKLALVATTLTASNILPIIAGAIPSAQAVSVTAKRADSFTDSVCVNTHFGYGDTPYGSQYNTVKQKLVELGVGHIRDGGTQSYVIDRFKDLAAAGIKTTYIMSPTAGVAPDSSYWVNGTYYQINDLIKNKIGTNVVDAVEIANEIDFNYGQYYWHKGDTAKLNNNSASPLYWVSYIRSLTKDTWNALKSDPATAGITVIAPSLGRTYNYGNKSPLGDLSSVVDWGNVHSYPFGGNPFNNPFAYNTLAKYYYDGNFPSVNIDENPYIFDVYGGPFGSKPIAATETGYYTTSTARGVSETVHGKYMPRLFLEYFRKGIVRTCSYEFLNEWNQPSNSEANFGLLRNDLTPKPAYTALKNLLGSLKDPATNAKTFTPTALDYTLTVTPPTGYNRTQYVHSTLLQKATGTFYLVLWHEISNNDITVTPARTITPPAMPTKVTLTTPIRSATLSTWDDAGNRTESSVAISNKTVSVNVTDKVTILKLTP